ncbi:MAG TPA: hypothetical protein VIS06_03170, partial [Mycobacteriales bacterium]
MTDPAGAPDPTTTPPAPSPADMPPHPPADPAQPPANDGQDIASLPDWAQTLIRDARSEASKARTSAKANAADQARKEMAQAVAKALGIQTGDEPPDPAQLAAQVEAAKKQAHTAALHLSVYQAAGQTGADPDRLLDSRSFTDSLNGSVTAAPGTAEFTTQIADAVKSWTDGHPQFKTAGQAPAARSSAPITGGPGEGAPITEEQLRQMTPEQITEALAAGRLT